MKTPLHIFLKMIRTLKRVPLSFLMMEKKEHIIVDVQRACAALKAQLEKKKLHNTHAYRILTALESSIGKETIDDIAFVQALANLIEVYQQNTLDEKVKELVKELRRETMIVKRMLLAYHLLIESLNEKGRSMSEEQKRTADLTHLQNVGIFYVLEYTLQVFYEFSHLDAAGKKKILEEGFTTPSGNLPAFLPLEDTFRTDLCLKLYDSALRERLLLAFYSFEKILYSGNIAKIGPALKFFNVELLRAFQDKGMTTFSALIYKPFGNNVPFDQIIDTIKRFNYG